MSEKTQQILAKLREFSRANPLALVALAVAAGISVAHYSGGSAWLWTATCGILAILSITSNRSRLLLLPTAACAFAALHSYRVTHQPALPAGLFGIHTISGRVTSQPELASGGGTSLYILELDGTAAGARIHVRQQGRANIGYGDRVRVTGSIRQPDPPRNPGGFDFDAYLERNRLAGRIFVHSPGDVELITPGSRWASLRLATRCRQWMAETVTRGIDDSPDVTALLRAMILGDRDGAPPEFQEIFRNSGTMHLFAISGLHVGIFSIIALLLLKLLHLPRSPRFLAVIALIFTYAFVTGWRPSAVRAAIMLSVILIGLLIGRNPRILNSLGAAAIIILLTDTYQLFHVGFQLSFTVLVFIVLLAQIFEIPLRGLAHPDPFFPRQLLTDSQRHLFRVRRYTASLVAVAAAAWAGSAPVIWYHFGLVTPVATVANCFLLPLAYIILFIATLSLLFGGLGLTGLSSLANHTNWLISKAILFIAGWFAELPGGHFHLTANLFPKPLPSITVLDTSNGGASHVIETKGDTPWVIDAGSPQAYTSRIRPFLEHRGINRIGGFILTHGDIHHAGGSVALVRHYSIRDIYTPPSTGSSPYALELTRTCTTQATAAGATLTTGPDTTIEVLYPPPGYSGGIADDNCLVLRLHTGRWRILFTADAGFETEHYLLESGTDLTSDVLVMGKHRSDASATRAFLRAVSPRVVIASDGHFPSSEKIPGTLRTWLAGQDISLFAQSTTGAVTLNPGPDHLEIRGFLGGRLVLKTP